MDESGSVSPPTPTGSSDWQASARRIGQAIVAARREYGLTQQDLADLVGLSDRTVRDIEKGTGSSSFRAVLETAQTLGLSWEIK